MDMNKEPSGLSGLLKKAAVLGRKLTALIQAKPFGGLAEYHKISIDFVFWVLALHSLN